MNAQIVQGTQSITLHMGEETLEMATSEAPLQFPVPVAVHGALMGYVDKLTNSQIIILKV